MGARTSGWATAILATLATAFAPAARATTLDILIASSGTVAQGDLVFSNFSANILGGALGAANVDVTGLVGPGGASGLRFTGVPAGSFSQSTTGGGAREIIVDVGFTVTVSGTSFRIHGVQQALDPAAVAHNNGKINNQTTIPPSGPPLASLFSCIEGAGVPTGQTCNSPIDSAVLNTDASSLIVDRQIQILVGQKGGATVGDASTGFFDISFPEAAVTCTPPATPTAANSGPICAGGTLALTTPTVAGATYSWTGPNAFTSSLQNPSIPAATTLATGTYSVTVTVAGCTSAAGTTVATVNAAPATPTAANSGPICAGGTLNLTTPTVAGATYSWTGPNAFSSALQNPSIPAASTLATGTYSVTVTVAGCTSLAGTTVATVNAVPATPTISGPSAFCAGSSITLTSSSATGSLWSTGATTQSITVSAAGSYTVTVTGANGCTATSAAKVVTSNPLPPTPTISGPSSFCAGSSITLTSSSATGNSWSTGATTQSITVSAAGSYTVTVTDANGCTATSAAKVVTSNPLPATPTISGPSAFCAGSSITLTSSSATGNSWSTGATTQSITVSAAGSYTVTVTDANGCTATSAAKIVTSNPLPATPTISGPSSFCAGSSITLTSSSATGNSWSTGATTQSITVSAAGSYTVTVTDANGCTATSAVKVVTANPLPATPTISGPSAFCAGSSITLTSSSATGNSWSTGATTQSITVSAAGSYIVTVTDANGCTVTSAAKVVTANPLPATPTISGPSAFCAGSSITLTSSSATGNLWSTGAITQSITVSAAGSYTVTVTDINGCTATSAAKVVTANPLPAAPLATNNGPVCEGGTLQLTASIVAGATYQWTGPNGFTSSSQLPTISPVTAAAAGTYIVTATVGGCPSAPATTVVSVNAKPALPVVTAPASVGSASTFTASVTANAGSTFAWSVLGGTLVSGNGTAQVTVTAGAAGSVTLNVIETNAAGCASPQASRLVPIIAATQGSFFYTLAPCRVIDTRLGSGALAAGEARVFAVAGVCGIPATAKALSVNLAAVPTQGGQLTLYPGDQPVPGTNTLSFRAGIVRAVNSVMGMGANGTLGVVNFSSGPADVIIDVNGYFQ